MKEQAYVLAVILCCSLSANGQREFPADFLFGTATAAYQIEGAWNLSGKGENIWDRYTHKHPELILDQSTGDIACDSYYKFREDVALLKEMNVKFYRFSLSWSRILPTGFAYKVNPDGIRYYNQLIDLLLENDIQPMVTLFHWDTPQPLEDLGGFTNSLMVDWFEEYAKVAFENFGRVKLWLTFNEPKQTCFEGYGSDNKAPGYMSSGVGDYICAHNLIKAHARVYHLYDNEFRAEQNGRISITIDTSWIEPNTNSQEDVDAAERKLLFLFGWYADPIFHPNGDYPQVMKDFVAERSAREGFPRSRLPVFNQTEIDYIKGTYDYLGLNHYTTLLAETADESIGEPSFEKDAAARTWHDDTWPESSASWLRVVPWGFTNLLNWIKNRYGDVEIYITENGFADQGTDLQDTGRVNYYRDYLDAMLDAMIDGQVNVKAYAAWSLLDNFEWRDGYVNRFGLHSVDFNNPERPRTAKASAVYYKQVIETRRTDVEAPTVVKLN